jgi:ribonuclease G
VSAWFTADGARELHALEEQTRRYFHFEGSEGLPLDHFAVTMEGTREDIEERAVPFRVGEEVHVDIVEPHMYNPDDGVAKVDGYLISVTGGIGFVGEKKLVRIEEAGRTAAVAALTGADAEVAAEAATERATERKRVEERARRSAAAKRGAAARRVREEEAAVAAKAKAKPSKRRAKAAGEGDAAEETAKPRRGRAADEPASKAAKPRGRRRSRSKPEDDGAAIEIDATRVLAEDDEGPDAGTAPAAVEEAGVGAEAVDGNGDALSSRPRRRGRRGGRRRSRAKASADAEE